MPKSLCTAKRWWGIAITAGPEEIAVQRQSKDTNMWLSDSWLAEFLLDEINNGKETSLLKEEESYAHS
jgi:hypothetical protein